MYLVCFDSGLADGSTAAFGSMPVDLGGGRPVPPARDLSGLCGLCARSVTQQDAERDQQRTPTEDSGNGRADCLYPLRCSGIDHRL
jgi:hypothetical protein